VYRGYIEAEPMFTERANAYQDFASLANGLPSVYVEKIQMTDVSFLKHGIDLDLTIKNVYSYEQKRNNFLVI